MSFSPKSPAAIKNTYFINSEPVHQQDLHQDLGIIMSSDLSWSAHYCHILSNAYKMLHLLQQIFSTTHCPQNKRALYVSLIKSKLMYNSPLWHPQLIKDITVIELVQWRATKYILSDYSSSYKARLITLKLLPLMMQFELNDVLFFVNCLKNPTNAFNIYEYVTFSSHTTRCTSALKLKHSITKTNSERHSYFNRLPRLWNSLPVIDLSLSLPTIKKKLKQFFWEQFNCKFSSDNPCTYHFVCPCSKCLHSPILCTFTK